MSREHLTTCKKAVENFMLDCSARRLKPKTLAYYSWQLGQFIGWLDGRNIENLQDVSPLSIRAYLVSLQDRGLKGSSQHGAARAIRAWLNFCVADDLLTTSPMKNIKMPRVDREILAAYSEDQIARLLEVCKANTNPDRDTAIVLTLLDTGARASEFVALNTNDIDLSRGTARINCGKGGKGRLVFVGAKTRKALARYLASRSASDNPALWLSENNGKRICYMGLQMFMRRLEARSGVEVECHKFRRTCALMLHRNGARLTEIAQILGHSDLSVLRRYLDLQSCDAERAHRQCSPVDNLKV